MSDTRTGQERLREVAVSHEPGEPAAASGRRLLLLLLTALTGFGLICGAGKLPEQTRLLLKVVDAQLVLGGASTVLTSTLVIGRVAVIRFYVEDYLGGNLEQSKTIKSG